MRSTRAQKNLESVLCHAIVAAGFNQVVLTKRAQTAEYEFIDPRTNRKYTSHSNGYVRCKSIGQGYYTQGIVQVTPITKEMVDNPIERLVYILRRAQSPVVNY